MAKVYVDAGHGGNDSGAVKYVKEKDVNLTMALACRDYLQANGVTVKMSRTADTCTSINNMAREANNWGADLVVSIHNNSGRGDGFEVYHSIVGGKGKTLAKNIEAEVKAIGQNSRGLKTKKNARGSDYFGMIRLTNAPCVICEGAFVDNATDVQAIDTVAEQQAFGVAYAKGILKTLGMGNKPEPPKKKAVEEDGFWGQATTRHTQRLLGCSVIDGIVSNQLNTCKRYLPNMLAASWEFMNIARGGSVTIVKLQKLVGANPDGYMGKATVKQLQLFLKKLGLYTGAIDGIAGVGTVKGWQKYINKKSDAG